MNQYEKLIIKAEENDLQVVEKTLHSNAKGLIKNNKICIRKDIPTTAEKSCVLAEELGHYHITSGHILDLSKVENRKQERKARAWAYERLVCLKGIIKASKQGIRNRCELAEFFGVPESFLAETIQYYKEKYGIYCKMDDYIIYFEPLGVLKKL